MIIDGREYQWKFTNNIVLQFLNNKLGYIDGAGGVRWMFDDRGRVLSIDAIGLGL